MDWIPTVSELQGPAYLRVVDALASDIASGRLVRGQRLPTHRALAAALDIDRRLDSVDLCSPGPLWLARDDLAVPEIGVSTRIGISRDAAHRDFERAVAVYFNRYTAASAPGAPHISPALMRELGHCFRDEWATHGDILNP